MRYLWLLAAFGLTLGTLYYVLTGEWTGAVLLWFTGLMPLIVAAWTTRRGAVRERRPEDDPDADPADSRGESLGSFPLASAWPLFLVLGVITLGMALIYGLILLPVAVGAMCWAVVGFMRESRA
jgi:Cytochrome c oxidase subunit IV